MDETGVKMSTMLDDGASTASIPSPTHWYDDPQRALGAELVEILTRTPFVLVLAYYVGKAFAKARLPRISGYLVTGVVCGSHVLGILGRGATRRLAGLDNLCLAVIGVAAGSELHLADLRRSPKPTLIMTAAITAFSWAIVFVTFCVVAPSSNLDFLDGLSVAHVVAVGSLAATLSVARSPASALAVLREMEGRGPFCSLVMSVTVVKDVLVVVMFAVNLELVAAARLDFSAVGGGAGLGSGSGAGGGLGGGGGEVSLTAVAALVAFMPRLQCRDVIGARGHRGVRARAVSQAPADRLLANGGSRGGRSRRWLSASSFWAAKTLGLEPLLLCLARGARGEQAARRRREERERLESVLRASMPLVNVVFFTLAGCAVHLVVCESSVVAALLVGSRLLALYHAARIGCDAIGAPESHKRVAWMGYVTQAGVALGLVRTAAARFPRWGMSSA